MNDQAPQVIYRSVVLAKLLYASIAWWGFTAADYQQRIEGVVHKGVRSGLYSVDGPTTTQLVMDSDDAIFDQLLSNEHHILHKHLPKRTDHNYQLRPGSHNLSLSLFVELRFVNS